MSGNGYITRVEGVIIKDGIETEVSGIGYHDHNWGYSAMSTHYNNWYWGKVHTEDISIDYSVMIPHSGKPMAVVLATDENGTIFEPKMTNVLFKSEAELNDIRTEPELGFDFANNFTIRIDDKNFKMDLEIEVDHLVMKQKAKFVPSESAYRYIGKETMTITRNGEEKTYNTESLHEIVFLEE